MALNSKPSHPLEEVKNLVVKHLKYNEDTVWFSASSRSIDKVVELYPHFNARDAVEFILNGIMTLSKIDYCFSNIQWGKPELVADVYGVYYKSRYWFVKFLVEDNCLEQISFHLPEKPMKTINGNFIAGVKL